MSMNGNLNVFGVHIEGAISVKKNGQGDSAEVTLSTGAKIRLNSANEAENAKNSAHVKVSRGGSIFGHRVSGLRFDGVDGKQDKVYLDSCTGVVNIDGEQKDNDELHVVSLKEGSQGILTHLNAGDSTNNDVFEGWKSSSGVETQHGQRIVKPDTN